VFVDHALSHLIFITNAFRQALLIIQYCQRTNFLPCLDMKSVKVHFFSIIVLQLLLLSLLLLLLEGTQETHPGAHSTYTK
jgi:hypothetical protein